MGYITFHSGDETVIIKEFQLYRADSFVRNYAELTRERDDDNINLNIMLNKIISHESETLSFLALFVGLTDPFIWVRGSDRAWLADVITKGLEQGLLCPHGDSINSGWDALVKMLRRDQSTPVATTLSINYGYLTDAINKNYRKLCKILSDNEDRRIGPDNIHIQRFKKNDC